MSKSFQIIALFVLLLVLIQSVSPIENEKYLLNKDQIQFKSNEFKEYSETNDISVKSNENQNILKEDSITELHIEYDDNIRVKYIGYQGILNFVLDHNDNETNIFNASDIEEKTSFETTIVIDNNTTNSIDVTCKLWKPIDEKLNMYCKLNNNLTYGEHSFNLSSSSFYYNDKKFDIIQNANSLNLFQLNETLPFLYSSKQILNIDEKTETCELILKIGEYNNEPLFMQEGDSGLIALNECTVEGKELICKIKKDTIEEFATNNGQKFDIYYFMLDNKDIILFNFNDYTIYDIYINYTLDKTDIYVEITKLLENNIDFGNYIAYETNVSNISNVDTKKFFTLKLSTGNNIECLLKKTEEMSLVMICLISKGGEFSLGEIENQTIVENTNIKYNFIIQPINNTEKCIISGDGGIMLFAIQKVLDFTLYDSIIIDLAIIPSFNSKGIKLNPEGNDLECTDIKEFYKRCTVSISHFNNKTSGYYYTHHDNHLNKSIIFYESSPFKVILPKIENLTISIKKELNQDEIKISNNGVFFLVTDYNNKEKKIFKTNDNITFVGKLIDYSYEDPYEVNCKFWILTDDNLRIICKSNRHLTYSPYYMHLNKAVVIYKNYIINIEQNEQFEFIEKYEYAPILYSEKQTINLSNDLELYELKFKIEEYNNDLLYIYGFNDNYAILDNCQNDTEELSCKITKEKIESILTENNEQFKIGAINDTIGLIPLEHILNITIKYENVQKEDIIIQLTKIVGGITEKGTPFAYETNITDFPSFISQKFNNYFYIKKISNRPLMLFCDYPKETEESPLKNNSQGIIIENAHYKYNFRIQPFEIQDKISIRGEGIKILLTYPEELNYTFDDTLKIRYIINEPSYSGSVELNPSSEISLVCTDVYKMIVCNVPKEYFNGLGIKSRFYNTYHINHYYLYSIYYDSPPIKVTKPFEINIRRQDNMNTIYIGDKGTLYLISDYNDTEENIFNETNIEEKTKFTTLILCDNKIYYNISCHLWKNTEGIICIFCTLYENLGKGKHKININKTNFNYDNHIINFVPLVNDLTVQQFEKPLPFLYSKRQLINIEEEKDDYCLKFNTGYYNNEHLIILPKSRGRILLDKCSLKNKELICNINKKELEEFSLRQLDLFVYYPYDERGLISFKMVEEISVNYTLPKINLNISIGKLIEDHFDLNNFFAYEANTNDTNIQNLSTESFSLNFEDTNGECFFKKVNEKPLYLLCSVINMEEEAIISLSEIKEEIILTEIHSKYNFYIQPVKNDEKIILKGEGSFPMFTIQKTLDFSKNDELTLELILVMPYNTKSIKLNLDSDEELKCNDLFDTIKKCIVPKSHFVNKESGYYFIYHLNHLNKYIKFYEYSPIQVIFSNELILKIKNIDDKDSIKIGQKGVISFITDFEDIHNIFDSEIETKIINVQFSGNNKNYTAKCHLWKPLGEKLRLICQFNENIDAQKLKLIKFIFDYKDFNIAILSEEDLRINQLNSSISFLYSDKQIINITNTNTEYNLVFKSKIYNKESLILYNEGNNMKNIYLNCIEETKQIKCTIKKDELVGILSKSGEKFCLSQVTKEEGIITFNNVLDIILNYENVDKKNININIIKLLTPKVDKNSLIAFETNIDDIPIITTDYFIVNLKKNDVTKCHFKKHSNQKDDKLLLLCNADTPGEYIFDINETNLDNLNILYSFKKIETKTSEKVTISENEGTKIISVYPDSLNFTSQDELIIRYHIENPGKLKNIKLNNNSTSYLECKDKNNIKECTVPKSHFNESGYYYTYYTNSFETNVISYEIPKIQITIKKEDIPGTNKNLVGIIVGPIVGGLVLIAAIVFIVIYAKKKKDNSREINGISGNILPKEQVELLEGEKFE